MSTREVDRRFESAVEEVLRATWEFYPHLVSGLGLHEYDGRLSDISGSSLARRSRELGDALDSFAAIDPAHLTRQGSFDHRMLAAALRKELFELTELKLHETNPMEMLWHVELSGYVKRDYAPLERRVEALTRALQAVSQVVDGLREALGSRLSRAVLESSIEAYAGVVAFYDKDLPEAVQPLNGPHPRASGRIREGKRARFRGRHRLR